MYEERRDTFSLKDVLLEILLIAIFIFILICIFPARKHIKKLFAGNKNKSNEVVLVSSNDIEKLASKYGKVYANNIINIKDAAIMYYTSENLPEGSEDTKKLTLADMYDKSLILKMTDDKGVECDSKNSYVLVSKDNDEYEMKINLSCGDYDDNIVTKVGNYEYCDTENICEKKETKLRKSNSNEVITSNDTNTIKCDEKENKLTVFFDSMGGSHVSDIDICTDDNCDKKDIKLEEPKRDGYIFKGWYIDSEYSKSIDIKSNKAEDINSLNIYNIISGIDRGCGYNIDSFTILYAKWQKDGKDENEYVCEYIKKVDGWSDWSTKVETKVEHEIIDTKYEEKEDTKSESYIIKYKEEKKLVGTKKVDTGKTETKIVYEKVPAGKTLKYIKTESGTSIPKETNDYKYVKKSSKVSNNKTIYTWDVYKKYIVYKAEKKTINIPIYKTENIYKTVKVPVYGTRKVKVKKKEKIDIYGDVTYYRYKLKQNDGDTTKSKWSTCNPVDECLINEGYEITDNKKKA